MSGPPGRKDSGGGGPAKVLLTRGRMLQSSEGEDVATGGPRGGGQSRSGGGYGVRVSGALKSESQSTRGNSFLQIRRLGKKKRAGTAERKT